MQFRSFNDNSVSSYSAKKRSLRNLIGIYNRRTTTSIHTKKAFRTLQDTHLLDTVDYVMEMQISKKFHLERSLLKGLMKIVVHQKFSSFKRWQVNARDLKLAANYGRSDCVMGAIRLLGIGLRFDQRRLATAAFVGIGNTTPRSKVQLACDIWKTATIGKVFEQNSKELAVLKLVNAVEFKVKPLLWAGLHKITLRRGPLLGLYCLSAATSLINYKFICIGFTALKQPNTDNSAFKIIKGAATLEKILNCKLISATHWALSRLKDETHQAGDQEASATCIFETLRHTYKQRLFQAFSTIRSSRRSDETTANLLSNLANVTQVLEKQVIERSKYVRSLKVKLHLNKVTRVFYRKLKLQFHSWKANKLNDKRDVLLLEYISFLEDQVRESDESRSEHGTQQL